MTKLSLAELRKSVLDSIPNQRQVMKLANTSGIAYYWIMSILVFYTTLYVAIPEVWGSKEESFTQKVASFIFVYFFCSMMMNYVLCLITNTFYDAGTLRMPKAEGGKNWGYCVPCQQYMPPRAHHCVVCSKCVLKRDSHCFFVGRCAGHRNHSYFVVFVFYCALSTLFSFLCYATYLNHIIGPFVSWQTPYYLYPIAVIRWLAGSFPLQPLFILTMFYTVLVIGIGCTMLAFHHFNLILRGQTSYEMSKRNAEYDAGAQVNLREVFGRYWWLSFILPVKFGQSGDGIHWGRVKDIKAY
ncbi:palmitoyltransferase ZDHHC22-like [Diadema antillarum]|uniref:palmitoyltransferase ZDHHC22-like n=1 Tax=Diadema antillarum TaxID=105358 RepID=UPI003A88FE2E